jgi:signal peptidase I
MDHRRTVTAGTRGTRQEAAGVAGTVQRRALVTTLLAVVLGGELGALAADRSRIVVAGSSMAPTLLPGEVVLTVPAVGRWLRPGQVVVLRDPGDRDHLVVKRLAAVADGQVFVLGDDPHHSTDSRTWGWLPIAAVRRLAVVRWPDVRSPLHRVVAPTPTGQPGGGRRASTSTSGSSNATSPSARRP